MYSSLKYIFHNSSLETINENKIVNDFSFSNIKKNIVKDLNKLSNTTKLSDKSNNKSNNKSNKFYFLSLLKENGELNWSIHGLWPQYTISTYPTFCKAVTFDINKLKPILDDLNKYWKSNCDKNDKFWEHEWKKHGSCVFSDIDELEYFKQTISLYKQAIEYKLPFKYYNKKHKQCLIPVTTNFELIDVELTHMELMNGEMDDYIFKQEYDKKIDELKIN